MLGRKACQLFNAPNGKDTLRKAVKAVERTQSKDGRVRIVLIRPSVSIHGMQKKTDRNSVFTGQPLVSIGHGIISVLIQTLHRCVHALLASCLYPHADTLPRRQSKSNTNLMRTPTRVWLVPPSVKLSICGMWISEYHRVIALSSRLDDGLAPLVPCPRNFV